MKFNISKDFAQKVLKSFRAEKLGWCQDLSFEPTNDEICESLILAYMALCNSKNTNEAKIIKALIEEQKGSLLPESISETNIDDAIEKALDTIASDYI